MKSCANCGREVDDEAGRCLECGNAEFVTPSLLTESSHASAPSKTEVLPPDRPKLIVVAGVWAIFGIGLVGNTIVLHDILTGGVGDTAGAFGLPLCLVCGWLCAYCIVRAVKNYRIQKERAETRKRNVVQVAELPHLNGA